MKNLLLLLVLFLFSTSIFAQIATKPTIGNGSEGYPYRIRTLENLYWLSQNSSHWNKHYIQAGYINAATTSAWDSNKGWEAIGSRYSLYRFVQWCRIYYFQSLHQPFVRRNWALWL